MKRALLVGAVALIAAVGGSSTALAGGSWLEPRDVDGVGGGTDTWDAWAAPGAVVTMAGDFCDGQGASPGTAAWTAYLRSGVGRPSDRIEIGPVVISPAAGNGCAYLATATFAVPAVAPGVYWVNVCADRSCSEFPGDLMGGMLTVAATSLEAELLREREDQAAAIDGLRRDRSHLRTDVARLEETVSDVQARFRAAAAEMQQQLADSADNAERALARHEEELAVVTARADRWRRIALGLGILVAVALAAMAWFAARRRRNGRVSVPDSPAVLFEDLEVR